MTRDKLIAQALAFPGAVDDYPFGEDLLIVKVGGKVFAWIPLGDDGSAAVSYCEVVARLPRSHRPSVGNLDESAPRRVPLRGVRSTHSCGGKV